MNVLLGTVNVSEEVCLVFEIKNVVSFIKVRFYWKRDFTTMRNYVETFQWNSMYDLIYKVFTQIS